ncbi:MAG: hypothetical protein H6712_14960 [Myxococcales bacterium]|nr:hypothetical protein [Myxococcales bacterium]
MPAVVALMLVLSLGSVLERARRGHGGISLDAIVLATTSWLVAIGLLAVGLALVGAFTASSMSVVVALLAGAAWPWGRPRPATTRPLDRRVLVGLAIVLGGVALRLPVADYALAGRDQGTYALRAQHTLREASLDAVDPVLTAIEETRSRPGPADLLGLYPRRGEPWRRDRYEASYRPGFYLADLDSGHVRPQFLHLHPTLMAVAGLVLGPDRVSAIALLWSGLALLAMWALARRLWPSGPWAWLALGLWAVHPLAIWTQRTTLSEGPATVLVLGAALAVLRARDGEPAELDAAALLLGALAWVRGNGWLAAPLLLAAQWLVPQAETRARRSGLLYAALFGAAVLAHASTSYPYLHDELLRQLPLGVHLTPSMLVVATVAGLAAWFALDEQGPLRRHESRWLPVVFRAAPWGLAALLLGAMILYLAQRGDPPARPFSRLDAVGPLVGPIPLLLAALGLGRALRRWPTTPSAAGAWQLGLAALLTATVGLYAQRNLPQLGFYYYGRYLVPELLPAVLLLAVEGLRAIHGWLAGRGERRRGRIATAITGVGGLGLLWAVASVLLLHPVTRLPEFEGAERVVAHLAAQIPEGSIVIAGGEGWHSGHTFNQVGGALAFRHGITVLPYRDREAAYASLHELLVGRPEASGEPPPPVFLLLNEATKDHTRDPGQPPQTRVAALDDLLPPPFVARRIELVEMFLDRLTPTSDGPPVRVTRDGLRMALLRVEVDPAREAEVERWRVRARQGQWEVQGPSSLEPHGGEPREDQPCLGREPLVLRLPKEGAAGSGPVSLVLVALPGTAARNHAWAIEVDGEALVIDAPRAGTRDRDTLGPFLLRRRPHELTIRGAAKATRYARCPHGGLAELRLLGPEAAMLSTARTSAVTFAPARSLGHPVTPVAWVSGRGLSRSRPGLVPEPEIEGLSMVVGAGPPLRFAPASLPDGGRSPIDLVVTLTGTELGPDARIMVAVDGEALPPIDPPEQRRGSWQSPALRLEPRSSVASITVGLVDAGPGERVLLRDIGLFSRATPVTGRLAEQ